MLSLFLSNYKLFYKKLWSKNENSISYENALFQVLSFIAVPYAHAKVADFRTKMLGFLIKNSVLQ